MFARFNRARFKRPCRRRHRPHLQPSVTRLDSVLKLLGPHADGLFAALRIAALAEAATLSHAWIALGAFVGGLISGLTGFGTGLVAMPFWLQATTPAIAAQLSMAGAAVAHVQTIRALFPIKGWRAIGPFVAAGIVGVPIGTLLLPHIPAPVFKIGIGGFLILFCTFQLIARGRWMLSGRRRLGDLAAGFSGGLTAGLAGLPGPIPIMWTTIHDWPRDEKRAMFQVFSLVIAFTMLTSSALSGLMTPDFFIALAVAVPGTILGAKAGVELYRRVDARGFDRIVLVLLILSGAALIASNL